ncbi:MAG: hypothetical protein EXQ86_08520 [Rhodospirillales bacterium]|nr:hypothetical protein [Rhodospirillales bacterium]
MMKSIIAAGVIALFAAAPAFAATCSDSMKKMDEMMKASEGKMKPADMEMAMKAKMDGDKLMKEKKDADCMKMMDMAMKQIWPMGTAK